MDGPETGAETVGGRFAPTSFGQTNVRSSTEGGTGSKFHARGVAANVLRIVRESWNGRLGPAEVFTGAGWPAPGSPTKQNWLRPSRPG